MKKDRRFAQSTRPATDNPIFVALAGALGTLEATETGKIPVWIDREAAVRIDKEMVAGAWLRRGDHSVEADDGFALRAAFREAVEKH